MPVPPSIPGYYYDDVKNRYFKILPNHQAPAGSKHSADSIRKKAANDIQRERRELHDQIKSQTAIERSWLRKHPLGAGVGLERELGVSFHGKSSSIAAWVQGLEKPIVRMAKDHCAILSRTIFAHDDATKSFFFGYSSGRGQYISVNYALPWGRRSSWLTSFLLDLDSEICSLAISPSRVLMVTGMGGSEHACVHLTTLAAPEVINDFLSGSKPASSKPPPSSYTIGRPTVLRGNSGVTFWTSSPRGLPSTADFALSTSSGTTLIASNDSSFTFMSSISFPKDNSSRSHLEAEVLSVDWLSHNTILNGCRDGFVRLWDVRYNDTSSPINHGSSIAHARKVNENKIIVAGLNNKLSTYDLRFLRQSSGVSDSVTRPYLSFEGYRNRDLNGLAIGFDLKGDLVAAGTDDQRVQFFDGSTGKELRTGKEGELGRRTLYGTAGCMKFVDGVDGEEELRLYVSGPKAIEKWSW